MDIIHASSTSKQHIEAERTRDEEPSKASSVDEPAESRVESGEKGPISGRRESSEAPPASDPRFAAVPTSHAVFADDLESDLRRTAISRRQLQLQPSVLEAGARSRGNPGLSEVYGPLPPPYRRLMLAPGMESPYGDRRMSPAMSEASMLRMGDRKLLYAMNGPYLAVRPAENEQRDPYEAMNAMSYSEMNRMRGPGVTVPMPRYAERNAMREAFWEPLAREEPDVRGPSKRQPARQREKKTKEVAKRERAEL